MQGMHLLLFFIYIMYRKSELKIWGGLLFWVKHFIFFPFDTMLFFQIIPLWHSINSSRKKKFNQM